MRGRKVRRDCRGRVGLGGGGGGVAYRGPCTKSLSKTNECAEIKRPSCKREAHKGGMKLCREWKGTSDTGGAQSLKGRMIYTSNESVWHQKKGEGKVDHVAKIQWRRTTSGKARRPSSLTPMSQNIFCERHRNTSRIPTARRRVHLATPTQSHTSRPRLGVCKVAALRSANNVISGCQLSSGRRKEEKWTNQHFARPHCCCSPFVLVKRERRPLGGKHRATFAGF